MRKIKIAIRKKSKPVRRHDRDGRAVDDLGTEDQKEGDEAEPRMTLSQLLDQRRADAETAQTREDREAYMEKLEAYLKRPITAADLERPELGKLFGRRKS